MIRGFDVRAAAILFPALVFFMLLSVAVAALREAAADWLGEFPTTWRYVTKDRQ